MAGGAGFERELALEQMEIYERGEGLAMDKWIGEEKSVPPFENRKG
jgi:hypothetical protein